MHAHAHAHTHAHTQSGTFCSIVPHTRQLFSFGTVLCFCYRPLVGTLSPESGRLGGGCCGLVSAAQMVYVISTAVGGEADWGFSSARPSQSSLSSEESEMQTGCKSDRKEKRLQRLMGMLTIATPYIIGTKSFKGWQTFVFSQYLKRPIRGIWELWPLLSSPCLLDPLWYHTQWTPSPPPPRPRWACEPEKANPSVPWAGHMDLHPSGATCALPWDFSTGAFSYVLSDDQVLGSLKAFT